MNVIEELEDVLRMEQEHLLAGEFSDLATLVDRKAELADRLARDKPNLAQAGNSPAKSLRLYAIRTELAG